MSYIGAYIEITESTQEALDLKANISDVDTALALKADTTVVDTALALKADTDTVDNKLNQKTDLDQFNFSITRLDAEKADKGTVDIIFITLEEQAEAIASKSNPDTTETLTNKTIDATSNTIQNISSAIGADALSISQISGLQAELTFFDTELGAKADTEVVNAELALKASNTDLFDSLLLKADVEYVDESLLPKADISYVDERILTVITETDALYEALELKADITYVDERILTVITETNDSLNEALVLKADITYVNAGLALKENSLPTNTVKNNVLISSATGELSWTPAPISAGTYYCNAGVNDLSTVLEQVGEQQGAQIIVSSGSFGGAELTISANADNLAIIGPKCVPPIVELVRPVTVSGTRIRMSNIQLDGLATLTGNSCRYFQCDFPQNVVVGSGSNTGYITLEQCEFASGKTITINATGNTDAIYFINCNIAGATVVVNSASSLQVVFSNCAGFLSLPLTTKATLAGINVLASGVINNSIQRTLLATGRGTAGQVLTSGGDSGNDTWTTPSAGGGGDGEWVGTATSDLDMDGFDIGGIFNLKPINYPSPSGEIQILGRVNMNSFSFRNIQMTNPFVQVPTAGQVLTALPNDLNVALGEIAWRDPVAGNTFTPCVFSNTRFSGERPNDAWNDANFPEGWRFLPLNTIDDPNRTDFALEHSEGTSSLVVINEIGKYEVNLYMSYTTQTGGVAGRFCDINTSNIFVATNNVFETTSFGSVAGGTLVGYGTIQTLETQQRFTLQGYTTGYNDELATWGKPNSIPGHPETYSRVVLKRIS